MTRDFFELLLEQRLLFLNFDPFCFDYPYLQFGR